MADGATFSTSTAFDRASTLKTALQIYHAARMHALSRPRPLDSDLDRWGGAVDRVIATRAATVGDLANKVRIMIVERRGGEGCLAAILDDLDALAGGGAPAIGSLSIGEASGHA